MTDLQSSKMIKMKIKEILNNCPPSKRLEQGTKWSNVWSRSGPFAMKDIAGTIGRIWIQSQAQGVQVFYALFLQLFSNYETCYFPPLDYNYLCVVSLPSSSAVWLQDLQLGSVCYLSTVPGTQQTLTNVWKRQEGTETGRAGRRETRQK